uniref:Uncharacterized protein n=1 Tax=Sphaerodactylus townsendi TaxID=933632 RepID=A0ACB8EPY1_9SAUR
MFGTRSKYCLLAGFLESNVVIIAREPGGSRVSALSAFVRAELKLLEEAAVSVCKSLVENNPRTGNLGALIKVFLSRTKELKISTECQK